VRASCAHCEMLGCLINNWLSEAGAICPPAETFPCYHSFKSRVVMGNLPLHTYTWVGSRSRDSLSGLYVHFPYWHGRIQAAIVLSVERGPRRGFDRGVLLWQMHRAAGRPSCRLWAVIVAGTAVSGK
jgi:hypothetical protein